MNTPQPGSETSEWWYNRIVMIFVCSFLQEAKTNYRNFRDLIYNLSFRKNFSQLEKARFVVVNTSITSQNEVWDTLVFLWAYKHVLLCIIGPCSDG